MDASRCSGRPVIHSMKAFLVLLLLAMPVVSVAEQDQALQLPPDADIRIIVDISGSMKQNDPNNLRQPAVRLLARMIPAGSTAGVWTFGQWVNMLVAHGEVDASWRESAVSQSREINSVALRTNLGEAIRVASDPYLGGENLDTTDFILLTDGKVDVSDVDSENEQARQDIVGPLLTSLIDRGATIHTVALSDQADIKLLESLASESGGHFSLASSAEGLNRAFLKALNAAAPQEQIPLDEEGFSVDDGVEEFTALIFWGENETSDTRTLELISPNDTRSSKSTVADNMRWAAETGYDLITVTDPTPGQWRINGELGEGSRVTVVSDLRMVVSPVPVTFTAETPIDLKVAFFEDKTRLENPDFLNVLSVELRITSSDGRSGSKILSEGPPPEDGVYTDQISSLPVAGDYQIELVADGKTFSRQFSGVTRFVVPEVSPANPEDDGPIDISQVEVPEQPVIEKPADSDTPPKPAEEDPEQSSSIPLWMWAAAAGAGLFVVVLAGWLWVRRRADANKTASSAAVETQTTPEDAGDSTEVPVLVSDGEEEEVSEIPAVEDAAPAEVEESSEAEIPELETPEPETEIDSDIPDDGEQPEADDDEFGLEDFDLSEFDDLPEESREAQSDEQEADDGQDRPKKDDG